MKVIKTVLCAMYVCVCVCVSISGPCVRTLTAETPLKQMVTKFGTGVDLDDTLDKFDGQFIGQKPRSFS